MRIERERNAARGMVSDGVHVVYSQLDKQGAVSTAPQPGCCRIYASSRVTPLWPRTFACGSRSECGGIVSDGAVGLTGQTRCGSYRISLRCPCLRILTCSTNVARMFACGARTEWGEMLSDGAVGLTGQTGRGSYRTALHCPHLRILTCSPSAATHVYVWEVPGIGRDNVGRSGCADRSNRAR
jgi:hypothetical protein